VTLVNRATISDSSAYGSWIFLDDLTPCLFASTATFVSGVTVYDGGDGESKSCGKVDVRGRTGCENTRGDGSWTSLRLAEFASSTRSWSKSS
jgi:hypothetical protein